MCVLAVIDDEHDVGDDDDASSDSAEGHEGIDRCGKAGGKSRGWPENCHR